MSKKPYSHAITVGCFDVLHKGHTNLINEMFELSSKLHIGIHDDMSIFENKGHFPIHNTEQRHNNLYDYLNQITLNKSLYFYIVIVQKADPSEFLRKIIKENKQKEYFSKAVYVRGNDWIDFPGKQVLKNKDYVDIKYIEYTKGISSTKIRKKYE